MASLGPWLEDAGCTCTYYTIESQEVSHFAVFPPELPEVCIKAGTSEKGCCPECGAPWERVVERSGENTAERQAGTPVAMNRKRSAAESGRRDGLTKPPPRIDARRSTAGWQPTCDHEAEPVPCVVLDPFAGAGTTGLVALRLRRSFIGIELNPEYVELARNRIREDAPLFNASAESLMTPTDSNHETEGRA